MHSDNVTLCCNCVHFGKTLQGDPCYSGFQYQLQHEKCPYFIRKLCNDIYEDRHEENREEQPPKE